MLNREVAIHERAVRCQTLEIRKGYIPRRRTNSLFPMGFPIKTMGFSIKTMGFPIIYRIYRSSDPSTFVETGLTYRQFLHETWGAFWMDSEWSFSRQQNYWNMSTPQKKHHHWISVSIISVSVLLTILFRQSKALSFFYQQSKNQCIHKHWF